MAANQTQNYSTEERRLLLKIARQGVQAAASRKSLPALNLEELPELLRQPGACFITLHKNAQLRGCTGTLVAQLPLAQEVLQTAAQTAIHDHRFDPVRPEEEPELEIEISVLTPSRPLEVPDPSDLPNLIRPGIDGVTLRKGFHRATFLPQVWEQIPDPVEFLDRLCQKMGLPRRAWLEPGMEVDVYQVEKFSEEELAET
jgi:AmmeMemoRadiSam system protein A